MTYSVTFLDVIPAPRGASDGPWTRVRFEEAGESRRGPWTPLDTQTLTNQDTDPTDPQVRTVTTDQAMTYPGWFRIVWIDSGGGEQPTYPEYAGSAVRPTVKEVANLMPDRTTIDGSSEAGTFTAGTEPTADEVDDLMDMVLDSVEPRVPDDATAEVERAARHVVSLNTAILIETGRFGEQREVNDARVGVWERLLASHEATLDSAANQDEAGQARFGSLQVVSPTLTSWASGAGVSTTELLP